MRTRGRIAGIRGGGHFVRTRVPCTETEDEWNSTVDTESEAEVTIKCQQKQQRGVVEAGLPM